GRLGAHRVDVLAGPAELDVPGPVGAPPLEEGEVHPKTPLQNVGHAIEFAHLLAPGRLRADAGAGVEGGDVAAAGPQPFDKHAHRHHLDLKLTRVDLLVDG